MLAGGLHPLYELVVLLFVAGPGLVQFPSAYAVDHFYRKGRWLGFALVKTVAHDTAFETGIPEFWAFFGIQHERLRYRASQSASNRSRSEGPLPKNFEMSKWKCRIAPSLNLIV